MPKTDMDDFGQWTEKKQENPGQANQCADCHKIAPPTQTNFTLISSQHGWRLSFDRVDGRRVSVWRCPKCWENHKAGGKTPTSRRERSPVSQTRSLIGSLLGARGSKASEA